MKQELHVSADVAFPIGLMTLATAVLANRGAGKTYFAAVLTEELLSAGQQVIILDPVGVLWGLKSGYSIPVFGGDHADVPLRPDSGDALAKAVVEHGFSAIFDLSEMTNSGAIGFAADFLAELYRRNRQPCYVVIDEADMFAPQGATQGNGPKCLGAMQHLVRRGRARGLGCALITQRPQAIAKDVLTQCEVLVALRMNHPRDIGAVEEWIDTQASVAQSKEVVKSLPSLPTGEAWFWAPSLALFQRAKVRARQTFDSSATPKPGQARVQPKHLEAVDIAKLGTQIASTVEEQKANDPAALKKRIAELERERFSQKAVPHEELVDARNQVTDLIEGNRLLSLALERERDSSVRLRSRLTSLHEEFGNLFAKAIEQSAEDSLENDSRCPAPIIVPALSRRVETLPRVQPKSAANKISPRGDVQPMAKAERAILTVLAQHGASPKTAIAARAGYSPGGGGFNNSLSRLRVQGWISGSDPIEATPDGLGALGSYEPLPSGRALLDLNLRKVGKAEREILEVLAGHPSGLDKEDLAAATATQYAPTGGGFNNAISSLRTLQLVAAGQPIRLTQDFAEAIR